MDVRRKLIAKSKRFQNRRGSRIEERLKILMMKEDFYEAHQTLKVVYDRLVSQQRDDEALTILLEGAKQLLANNQFESGTDVAVLMVEHLKERKIPITDDLIGNIETVFKLYKCIKGGNYVTHPDMSSLRMCTSINSLTKDELARLHSVQVNREMFLKGAIKWTSLVDDKLKHGHPRFHKLLALAYFEEGDYDRSRKHFLYANMPEELGQVLVELTDNTGMDPIMSTHYISQAVLQLLVLGEKDGAFKAYMRYCGQHSLMKPFMPPPFPHSPLLNFIWFLMLSIDIGNIEVFNCLCSTYHTAISLDPLFFEYLMKIGEQYFGVKVASGNHGGGLMSLFGGEDMMSSLFPPSFTDFIPPPPFASGDITDGLD